MRPQELARGPVARAAADQEMQRLDLIPRHSRLEQVLLSEPRLQAWWFRAWLAQARKPRESGLALVGVAQALKVRVRRQASLPGKRRRLATAIPARSELVLAWMTRSMPAQKLEPGLVERRLWLVEALRALADSDLPWALGGRQPFLRQLPFVQKRSAGETWRCGQRRSGWNRRIRPFHHQSEFAKRQIRK